MRAEDGTAGAAIEVHPATAERWDDLEALFGPRGAYAGCWCMFWRVKRRQFKAQKGLGNREALKAQLNDAPAPGLLAYRGGVVIGWCGLGPRAALTALEESRILQRVDATPVWSVICFFIGRPYRHQGVARALLEGALTYARAQGVVAIEGYPIDLNTPQLAGQRLTSYSGYMGIASTFRALGFSEVGRASETQLIMRYDLEAVQEIRS